jgi:AraC-like DNA-binding protein
MDTNNTEIKGDLTQGILSKPKTDDKQIVQKLVESELYKTFREAFGDLTGLPLALRPRDYWHPPLHGVKKENNMCHTIAQNPRACSSCLETQMRLTESAQEKGQSVVCPMGMVDIAVPVSMSGQCVAFLHTGQLLPQKPTGSQFQKAAKKLKEWRLDIPLPKLEKSYLSAIVYSSRQQEAVIQILTQFSDRLSEQANALMIRARMAEPPLISKAKEYMKANLTEVVRLEDIAGHLNVSPFYFCRQFRKHTKLRFTDYLTRLRVEKAKLLLQNPNRRVSEVAFEAGFQSLPHFNRSFKRVTGGTPSLWREH